MKILNHIRHIMLICSYMPYIVQKIYHLKIYTTIKFISKHDISHLFFEKQKTFGIFHKCLKVVDTFFSAKLCEKLCETLREIDNQIFHAESRKGKNAKFRKEV